MPTVRRESSADNFRLPVPVRIHHLNGQDFSGKCYKSIFLQHAIMSFRSPPPIRWFLAGELAANVPSALAGDPSRETAAGTDREGHT
ncbi:hypothetical protein KBX37_26435 [Micromonospora sp. U56]|uniref:hypothetical protein n=1 Tax=Micromonospora sp. U56 TaxID=2824900 RepID=UPI001B37610D|nr:hypothetical protein [Micromonospora sp. U56]MBQ0896587.1 hypothetical protein [Micromonospora sp. U56]